MPYLDIEKQRDQRRRWKSTRRAKVKQCVADYLKTRSCADCGESNPIVLDFDHRDPKEKLDSIANLVSSCVAISRIETEMAKCDVRCANCHRKRHFGIPETFTTKPILSPMSEESREKIRRSKLGKPRTSETISKISASLQGNHCRAIRQLTGQVFGQLTVMRMGEIKPRKRGSRVFWVCKCACGDPEKQIEGSKLTAGRVKSCGCLRKKFYGNQSVKIG